MSRSLIPSLMDMWNICDYPQRIVDQHYRLGGTDDDFFPSMRYREHLRPRHHSIPQDSRSGVSEVVNTRNKFRVMTDVSHFSPEEITVKTVDNYVVVHGKHEEKMDQHGFVSREFTRRYAIPEDVDPEKVSSFLSSDGVLTVEAPKKNQELPANERIIPITVQKGPPIEEKEEQEAPKQ
ncbi:alpha-crystallin A chain-like [Centruroides sculpturatus]|uniref:alpha-crystallin A chain-like n=1 Tax=Centruroides sculpturatus TaxID=218467 RepID=UPI000C6D1F48|nr:alpha-crystallin A chain-like [Centruroides sculpturatus]